MKNNTINLGCCPICFSPYNHSDHEPRIVPLCGHSICLKCLGTIMLEDDHIFRCPICLRRVKFAKVETSCFPKNYSLLDLTEKLKTHEFCGTHHSQLELVCLKCKVKVCGKCVFRGEHRTHEVDVIEDYMKDTSDRTIDLKSWIECFDSHYKVPERMLGNQEAEIVKLVNTSFEKYIQSIMEKKSNIIWELKNVFRKIKTLNEEEESLDIESASGDIFEWKEKLKSSINKWSENRTLFMALEIRDHDTNISKELKKWTDSSASSKFFGKIKDVPSLVLPVLEKMKFFDSNIQDSASQIFKSPYSSIAIDIDSTKLTESNFENCIQLTEFLNPDDSVLNNYYLDNQNFTHHYIDKIQQLLFSSSRVSSFYLKSTTSLLSRERSKFIFSGMNVMSHLTDLSIELIEDKNFEDQLIEDFAHSLQSITTLKNFKLVLSDASKLSNSTLTRLFRSLSGSRSIENVILKLPRAQALSDESLQALAFSIALLTRMKTLEIVFSDARGVSELGLIPLASSFRKLVFLKKLKVLLPNFAIGDESIKSFTQHLENLSELKELELSFKGGSEITTSGLTNFSTNLSQMKQLEKLALDFESCKHINDKGIAPLSDSISKLVKLVSLNLNFDRCLLLTDFGLSKLGEAFHDFLNLETLFLSFRECSILADEGISSLCRSISNHAATLSDITLNLSSLPKITMESIFSIADAIKNMEEFQKLTLDLENCPGASDEALTSVIESISPGAQMLKIIINLKDCSNISNNLLKNLGNAISRFETLTHLEFDLTNCSKISDGGISNFTIFLPGLLNLTHLSLKFINLSKVTDDGISNLAGVLSLLSHLEALDIHLLGAPSVTMNSVNLIQENISRLKPASVHIVY